MHGMTCRASSLLSCHIWRGTSVLHALPLCHLATHLLAHDHASVPCNRAHVDAALLLTPGCELHACKVFYLSPPCRDDRPHHKQAPPTIQASPMMSSHLLTSSMPTTFATRSSMSREMARRMAG